MDFLDKAEEDLFIDLGLRRQPYPESKPEPRFTRGMKKLQERELPVEDPPDHNTAPEKSTR